MSQIYITNQFQTLDNVIASYYGADGSQRKHWQSLMLEANPAISPLAILSPYTLGLPRSNTLKP
ncbi:MAG: hypothetical protein COB04_08920 [Gammaproteobacteria bacterium]|nr:MAG: hypothetical protein COB04_08920 [Gammaproteobacteria bacterium]